MREIDAGRMEAWRGFLETHAAVTRILGEELRASVGMPLSWYDVLVTLEESPDGRLRMAELAERVVLSQSGVTRLVDRMSAASLVRREGCPTDGRGRLAVLTPEGQRALLEAAPTHIEGVWQHFASHLSDEETVVLGRALRRIHRAAQAPAVTSRD